MAIFTTPLGMNLTNADPVNLSPFVIGEFPGEGFPPPPMKIITTENDLGITTENGYELTTE